MPVAAPRVALALALALGAGLVVRERPADAGPSVVRDERLADLAITPALGRGYSPAANEMYSICFEDMKTTKASFDFGYAVDELELDNTSSIQQQSTLVTSEAADFLRDNTKTRVVDVGKRHEYVHYLLATLVVDSYYSSIDEGNAKLSESALSLLHAGDAIGFFTACGTHYVRSISRRSSFLTLFSYSSENRQRDVDFERQLDSAIHHISLDGAASKSDRSDSAKLSDTARTRHLKIVSVAIGLQQDKSVNLIPTDLDSYKESVREAFKASQDEFAGRITAIEISSWLANPTVVAALQLSPQAVERAQATDGHYASVQMLGHNAEFYTRLMSQVRDFEDLSLKADDCRKHVEEHFLENGAIPARLGHPVVLNQRTGDQMPLQSLVDALSDAHLAELHDAERAYAVGTAAAPGASQCVAELEKDGLSKRLHNEIPACEVKPVRPPVAQIVDDYCLPELAPVDIEFEFSSEVQPWLESAVARFQEKNPGIRVTLTPRGSFDAMARILAGADRPTLWSPSDTLVSVQLAEAWKAAHGTELFPTTGDEGWQPLALTPLVVVGWKDRIDKLVAASGGELSWRVIHDALVSPRGWASLGGPASWGAVKPVHGDPTLTNAGIQALLSIALEYYGRATLAPADIADPTFQRRLREIEDGVIEFPNSSRTTMDELVRWGPSWYDFAVVDESLAIEELEAAESRWGPLRVLYPRQTLWSDHPVVVLAGDWVTAPQRAAARELVKYLRSTEVQATALRFGVRPFDASVPLTSVDGDDPFTRLASRGVSRKLPSAVDIPSDDVINLLMKTWSAMVPASRRWDRPR